MMSVEALHERAHRATQDNYLLYKHGQLLHIIYNSGEPGIKGISLSIHHQFSMWQGNIIVAKTYNLRVGENILINRVTVLNYNISLNFFEPTIQGFQNKKRDVLTKNFSIALNQFHQTNLRYMLLWFALTL